MGNISLFSQFGVDQLFDSDVVLQQSILHFLDGLDHSEPSLGHFDPISLLRPHDLILINDSNDRLLSNKHSMARSASKETAIVTSSVSALRILEV